MLHLDCDMPGVDFLLFILLGGLFHHSFFFFSPYAFHFGKFYWHIFKFTFLVMSSLWIHASNKVFETVRDVKSTTVFWGFFTFFYCSSTFVSIPLPHPNHPHFPPLILPPFGFVHEPFIDISENPSSFPAHYPLPPPSASCQLLCFR